MTGTIRYRIVFILLLLCGSLFALEKNQLYLWNVETEISNIYILGSIHILNREFYPLPVKIESAFEETDLLVIEVDINNVQEEEILMLIFQKGVYTDGTTIADKLNDEDFGLLRNKLEELQLSVDAFLTFKPWLIAMTIQSLNYNFGGYDAAFGLDMYFLEKAGNREILELESMEYQLDMFTDMTEELQIAYLISVLTDDSYSEIFLEQAIEFWKAGDADSLYLLMHPEKWSTPLDKELFQIFFLDRNILMADRIESYLETGGNYFVIVGAGHLAGEGSIIDILNARGNKVIQIFE